MAAAFVMTAHCNDSNTAIHLEDCGLQMDEEAIERARKRLSLFTKLEVEKDTVNEFARIIFGGYDISEISDSESST